MHRRRMNLVLNGGVGMTLMTILLTGCAVGPDFVSPPPPVAGSYTSAPLPGETAASPGIAGATQRFIPGQGVPAEWWRLFRSEPMDRLIRTALAESPTLALARARILEARENRRAQFGEFYPGIDADLSAGRQESSGAQFGQPDATGGAFTLFNASVNVAYTFDLFGAKRRQLEALEAEVDYQRYLLEGAHLTLSSTIVITAVREASLRSEIRTTGEIAALQEKQLGVVEQRHGFGAVSLSDVLAQRTQLAQTRVALPSLEKELEQTRHQMAVLIGKLPGEACLPEFELEGLQLPEELPMSLPSDFVRQRPDIRAAEALLHAASARIGVATAQLYPQITLTGSFGAAAATPGNLFNSSSTILNLGAGLLQPLFHGGTLSARQRAAAAVYDQAAAQYRDTVLISFQSVADVLRALEADARTLKAQAETETIARDSLDLSRHQFEFDAVSYLTLLDAQRRYQEARIGVARARAARFADTAALFQALGGGWWNRDAQAGKPALAVKE